jgi:magnesium transporter
MMSSRGRRQPADGHHPVGGYCIAAVPAADPATTAAAARAALEGAQCDAVEAVFVLEAGRLAGVVPLAELLAAAPERAMASLMHVDWPCVPPDLDREDAASLAIHRGVATLALVEDGKFRGAVPATALMAILRDEHLEDLHLMAGIWHHSEEARAALEAPPLRRAQYRLPWLLIGLAGSIVATALVAGFESVLARHIALAFFMPAIVYLADAVGTQSEAVAVRGLSLTSAGIARLMLGELGTGMLIGLVLCALAFPIVLAAFGELALALTVSLSVGAAGTVATVVGLGLPWLFARAGSDPAFGSGPVGTVIQDVLSLAIYLLVASALMSA